MNVASKCSDAAPMNKQTKQHCLGLHTLADADATHATKNVAAVLPNLVLLLVLHHMGY